jgi:hypothetical protein
LTPRFLFETADFRAVSAGAISDSKSLTSIFPLKC